MRTDALSWLVILHLAALPVITKVHAACLIENAHYTLRGASRVTAGFQDVAKYPGWLTNVAFHFDLDKEGGHFWWLFDQGSARYLNMISTTDVNQKGWDPNSEQSVRLRPLSEMHVWFADKGYNFIYEVPKAGDVAPAHIFMPDLEEAMWYNVEPPRGVPTAFFDLVSCH